MFAVLDINNDAAMVEAARTALQIHSRIQGLQARQLPFTDNFRRFYGEEGKTIEVKGTGKVLISKGTAAKSVAVLTIDEESFLKLVDDETQHKLMTLGVVSYVQKHTAARKPAVQFRLNV